MADYEFNVDESLRPLVERQLTGTTPGDSKIAALPLPTENFFIRSAVRMIRLYRRLAPQRLRRRCVFEPSCSHYSELAIREYGLRRGLSLTVSRLRRCRMDGGGVDYPYSTTENKE